MEDCVFCKIIRKEIPSKIVFEDEDIIAFEDIHPVAPVHILVIPKEHIESMLNIEEKHKPMIGKIHLVIAKIAAEKSIDETGFRVICNCGEDGGQVVSHIHFHLIGGKKLGSKIVND